MDFFIKITFLAMTVPDMKQLKNIILGWDLACVDFFIKITFLAMTVPDMKQLKNIPLGWYLACEIIDNKFLSSVRLVSMERREEACSMRFHILWGRK